MGPRTPPHFEFSVKLYQKFTHPRMFKRRSRGSMPQRRAGVTDAAGRARAPNEADLDEFRRGIEPLASAGKLGALLAQFPPSFKDTTEARDYLARLLRAFADTGSPSNCGTGAGATTSATRSAC